MKVQNDNNRIHEEVITIVLLGWWISILLSKGVNYLSFKIFIYYTKDLFSFLSVGRNFRDI